MLYLERKCYMPLMVKTLAVLLDVEPNLNNM